MSIVADNTQVEQQEKLVTVTIDGFEISVPEGTLIIRAAELLGIQIPRFCDHPLLDPVGACRQCLVEVPDMGNGRGMPKPPASCTTTVMPGMVIKTQLTSPVADQAQRGIMEFLLINHPLDCPICDKGGECPLQNQAMSNGQGETRFLERKRTFPKPISLSSEVLLDRERCIQCARCTRFSDQIAGDAFIDLFERGAKEQVGIADGKPFQSYFSGNTVQICPVGALTGAAYRFRSRPFDLVSKPSVCEHCSAGCAQRTDYRRGKVTRRLAGDDPQVNEEWNCDKGRWAFTYATEPDRLTTPLVRNEDGVLEPASWPEALTAAARGLSAAKGRAGVLTGGRLTLEDAYAYAKFARIALGTNDIDFRARALSAEEADFLAAAVAGGSIEVSYSDLEKAPAVLLAGFEPEEESPIVFLRLRKAARKGLKAFSIAPYATRGLDKISGTLIKTVPGEESAALGALITEASETTEALKAEGAVILVGERLATSPGALSSAIRLAEVTGARLGWVPRRAGERGAVEAGALPGLLPVGRPVTDPEARAEVARAWAVSDLPAATGRDTSEILAAAADERIDALVIGGVDPYDLTDPQAALAAIESTPFVVSLEQRVSAVTDRADVVLPVAAVAEKSGTFVNWEGRGRPFDTALSVPGVMSDLKVLNALAGEMDVHLALPSPEAARTELQRLGGFHGARPAAPGVAARGHLEPRPGEAVLATWRLLLDRGRLQDGEPYLAGTAKTAVARLSAATAAELAGGTGVAEQVTVSTGRGEITLPVEITDMPDRVVWLPTNSTGSVVHRDLGVGAGAVVRIAAAGASGTDETGGNP
ncbi:NADH-quinone oxidoreductase subunit G [Actinomadura sp. HBU206391]|uniref:NADH-quinone oxidoreductase subunit G n=1 Tax=Actinomadura sp. HBU206391 TaxID=2731692 RepID=UPI00164EF0AE|nr:NADH-quinone oxidoreductase subunit G [Actinomadura sp. HBU206391]MBC6457701.1 NADH-quinone oxidoreductase subunit G [Actinomadura sp. HBU206391]